MNEDVFLNNILKNLCNFNVFFTIFTDEIKSILIKRIALK